MDLLANLLAGVVGGVVALLGSLVVEWFRGRSSAKYSLAHARWELRRDSFVNLLTVLVRMHGTVAQMVLNLDSWSAEQDASKKAILAATGEECLTTLNGVVDDFMIQRHIARLWLPDASLDPLADMIKQMGSAEPTDNEYWSALKAKIRDVVDAIAAEGRDDLKVNLPETLL